jgi:hypothetical protein
MERKTQKWEYTEAVVIDGLVMFINGKQIGDVGFFKSKGTPIREFLNQMGQEGWELVNIFPKGTEGIRRSDIFLKRPLE